MESYFAVAVFEPIKPRLRRTLTVLENQKWGFMKKMEPFEFV